MPKRRVRILCVDDEPYLIEGSVALLERTFEAQVTLASTTERAIREIQEQEYDLMTLDLMVYMEDISWEERLGGVKGYGGLVFLQRLRDSQFGQRNAELPVIVLSVDAQMAARTSSRLGAERNTWYCSKSDASIKLIEIVRQALAISDV